MEAIMLIAGTLTLLYGMHTLELLVTAPHKLKRLEPMRSRLGASIGSTTHFVSCILLPTTLGILMIFRGVVGESLF